MAGIIFSEGSGVNNSVFGKSQEPIRMFIEKKAEAYENQSVVDKIFTMETSKHFAEKESGMTSMNGFSPVGEGGAYPKDEMREGYDKIFTHTTWKDSFAITKEMIEDASVMNMRQKPAAFVTGYYRTREQFGAALLGGAIQGLNTISFRGTTFDVKAADGAALFSTAHTSITGGTANQSNRFTNTFDVDALGRIEEQMQNAKDDNGNILGVIPDTIIIPNSHALKKAVFAAIGADKDPATSNNGFNYQFGRWRVIVWAYLNQFIGSETTPYIIGSSQYNADNHGAVWYDRVALEVKSYVDENTDDNIWKGRARLSAGFNDWRAFAVGGVANGTTLA